MDKLLSLVRDKLNITWEDPRTDARLSAILADAVPAIAGMTGLDYDYTTESTTDGAGRPFFWEAPSPERMLLLNWCLYEWNHKTDLFWQAYLQEILACRQRHALETNEYEEVNDGGSTSESLQ